MTLQEKYLLTVLGAIGRVLGVEIKTPKKSINLEQQSNTLEAIAHASHIRIRRVILTPQWWHKDCGVLLGYRRENHHPVALLPNSKGDYEIFDPQSPNSTKVDKYSSATLAPEAYLFYKPFPEKSLQALDLIKFSFTGTEKDLFTMLAMGIVVSLLGMLTPQALALMVDGAIPDGNWGLLIQLALALFATTLGSLSLQFTQGLASLRFQSLSDVHTQAAMWDRLLNLRVSFLRQYTTGDLQARVSAIRHIRSLLSSRILPTLLSSFFALLNLALLFYYNGTLAWVALGLAIITTIVTTVFGILILQQFRPLWELEGQIFGLVIQLINGVSKLRLAGAQQRAFAQWAKQYQKQMQLTFKIQQLADYLGIFNVVTPTVYAVILFGVASNLSANFYTGTFLAFYLAFGIFLNGATKLSEIVIEILEIVTLWQRAKPILQAQPELAKNKLNPGKLTGLVQLKKVSFRYSSQGNLILNQVNIEAQPGEFIALVGASGSGKSTIFRLLLGFENPQSGMIKYDGQDLSKLDLSAVRRQMGVVLQNGRVNSASIFDNIAGGALISQSQAWEAARLAALAEDIEAMPMGMHTVVSEGATNLSGGQSQRLLIARALVLKPQILLLDEATSALDNCTQAMVSDSLARLQITRIVIAHRLSTIRHADRIYVLQAGKIVQQGNFEQLSKIEGFFQQLLVVNM